MISAALCCLDDSDWCIATSRLTELKNILSGFSCASALFLRSGHPAVSSYRTGKGENQVNSATPPLIHQASQTMFQWAKLEFPCLESNLRDIVLIKKGGSKMDRHCTEVDGCEKKSLHVWQHVKRTYTEILHFSCKPVRWPPLPISKLTTPLNI